jgi:ABC-type Na+ efflux pump permease subunit
MRRVLLVVLKELRVTVRDPHVVVYLAVPLILYPLLIWGVTQLAFVEAGRQEREPLRVAVYGAMDAAAYFAEEPFEPSDAPRGDAFALLEAGELDAAVVLSDHRATVHYSSARPRSTRAKDEASEQLRRLRQDRLDGLAAGLGLPASAVAGFAVVREDLAPVDESITRIFGLLLVALSLFAVTLASVYPALSATVAERESGTLETTLVSPVDARTLVLGKWGSVVVWGWVAGVGNLVAMVLTLGHGAAVALEQLPAMSVSPTGVALATPGLLAGAGVIAALLLLAAVPARTFKQGEMLLSLGLGPVMALVGLGTWGTMEEVAWVRWVPIAGLVPLGVHGAVGSLSVGSALATTVAHGALGPALLALGARFVQREDYVFGSGLPRWLSWADRT